VLITFTEDGDDPKPERMREELQDLDDPLEGRLPASGGDRTPVAQEPWPSRRRDRRSGGKRTPRFTVAARPGFGFRRR
jgi:hypothetical protein